MHMAVRMGPRKAVALQATHGSVAVAVAVHYPPERVFMIHAFWGIDCDVSGCRVASNSSHHDIWPGFSFELVLEKAYKCFMC
jgi:hypothetical protein